MLLPDYKRRLTAAADHAKATAGVQPPTPQLGELDVHPPAEGQFPTGGQVIPDLRSSPAAIVAVAEGGGMHTDYTHQGPVWQIVGLARATTGGR